MSKPVVCIGAALVDELFHASDPILLHTTNNVTVLKSAGGVSRNIAHQLSLLNIPIQLITVFGNDSEGSWLKDICQKANVQIDASVTASGASAKYTAIIDRDGSMFTALLSSAAFHLITSEHLEQHESLLSNAAYLLADANVSIEVINWLVNFSNKKNIPLIIESVSVPPAKKISVADLKGVYLITPNEDELPALCSDSLATTEEQVNELLQRGVQNVWLHRGAKGSTLYNNNEVFHLDAPKAEVLDCTGAGDGSLSGFIMSKYIGMNDRDSLKTAHTLSAEILQVNGAIATHIDQKTLLQLIAKYYPE
ncbi:carbohydrate kinase family protein [Ferruginibacter lapsinanis]|uniref:carbohydrate kinase family protein n=1 Tax=Ferruginibacter lapsinanis TaxID=563172 RepID=UPI001E31B831|nr:carbohydrate kinase family protein [Ferruginibacter lapsinanis]UEG48703.1 carbohydrate kinase family protein [Ferruginibacter lapsinanis]